ncbi:MAG: GGDEF domain-containing protein [Firmicutes bacterium]|nr:GGDEF domain-containing protein [Bacillota bacterium]
MTITNKAKAADRYFFIVGLLGATLFVYVLFSSSLPSSWGFIFLATLQTILHQFASVLPSGVRISVSFPVVMTILFSFGLPAVAVALLPANLLRMVTMGYGFNRVLFNASQMSIAAVVSLLIYQGLGGTVGNLLFPAELPVAIVAVISYDVVNLAFATGRVVIEDKAPYGRVFWSTLIKDRQFIAPMYYLSGIVMTILYQDHGTLAALLLSFILLSFHFLLQLHSQVAETRLLAMTDEMTGVYNYRYFEKWLAEEGQTLLRARQPVTFLFVDFDRLKMVNDGFGHLAGDIALKASARLLRESTRNSDIIVRYAGDEFLVILPRTDFRQALPVADRIKRAVEETVLSYDGQPLPFGLSLGMASFPQDAENLRDLIKVADKAMYTVKGG